MDIEFIVHDIFALTRPQWKLASNIEEASRAFQLAMAQDQKNSRLNKSIEMEPDVEDSSDDGVDDGEGVLPEPDADADEDLSEEDEVDVRYVVLYAIMLIFTRRQLTEIWRPLILALIQTRKRLL
jgi:regulator of nonsense transcripts 2